MKKCAKCGQEYDSNFCPNCGSREVEHAPEDLTDTLNEAPDFREKKKDRIPAYVGVGIAVLLIGLLAIFINISSNMQPENAAEQTTSTAAETTAEETETKDVIAPPSPTTRQTSPKTQEVVKTEKKTNPPKNYVSDGMYKVGTELSAGEYVVQASGDNCYIEIDKDSLGVLDSIIINDNVDTHRYITVYDGEYVKISGGYLRKESDVFAFSSSNGVFKTGMFKVGKDIQPGEYKLKATDDNCYYEIITSSRNVLDNIITNDNLSYGTEVYVTLSAGQYIYMNGGEIFVK